MAKTWNIKGLREVDNEIVEVVIATVHDLEFHGEWMAESFVTVTVKSHEPIDWHFDDYIEYNNEVFSINYDPSVIKKARRGTYGEGFTYDNVKLYFLGNKAKSYEFKDVVLFDNNVTYTSLSKFSFFCASIEDLADRLQANFDRDEQSALIANNPFRVLTPSYTRTLDRCPDVTQEEWLQYFDNPDTSGSIRIEGETDINIDVDNQNCFDVLKNSYEKFGLAYYFVGTTIIIGGKAIHLNTGAQNIFRYGKGLGLYEIERTSDDSQELVTKLFAYGSEQNMPLNYYANLGKTMFIPGERDTRVTDNVTTYGLKTNVVLYAIAPAVKTGAVLTLQFGNKSVRATLDKWTSETGDYVWLSFVKDDLNSDLAFYNELGSSVQMVNVVGGADINLWPATLIDTDESYHYPNALSINRLMLPGFPTMSLHAWVTANHPELLTNYEFSTDPYDPWIKSKHIYDIGLFEGTVNYDGSQQKEIYPTINNTGAGVVTMPSVITDNGYVTDPDDFEIEVADDALDWDDAIKNAPNKDDVAISMTSGFCTGRDFKVKGASRNDTDDGWVLTLERFYDSSLSRYFPYHDSYESGYCQIRVGDTFAVLGIQMPDAYIEAAAERLLIAACGYLAKRDHMRYTYLPKIDEIFMQKDADANGASSYHDTVRAGMVLEFEDSDLGIWHSPYIDSLTIRENGNNGIPTYDVVLRDEKEKGALEKLTETIEELMANPPIQVVERQQKVLQYVEYEEWDPNGKYYFETLNTETGILETSMVWHKGKKWKCLRTLTSEEPGLNCADWVVVEGDISWYLDFSSTNGSSFYIGYVSTTVYALLFWGTDEMTDDIDASAFSWTRETESGKTAADYLWDAAHVGMKSITLTDNDMPTAWGRNNKAIFTCTVTVNDGRNDVIIQNRIIV